LKRFNCDCQEVASVAMKCNRSSDESLEAGGGWRSPMMTLASLEAKSWAAAYPIPEEPPAYRGD
jgi:hypothetical protein